MFGSGKKKDVRLTDKQIKELTRNMSGKELRQFNKSQKGRMNRENGEGEDRDNPTIDDAYAYLACWGIKENVFLRRGLFAALFSFAIIHIKPFHRKKGDTVSI